MLAHRIVAEGWTTPDIGAHVAVKGKSTYKNILES